MQFILELITYNSKQIDRSVDELDNKIQIYTSTLKSIAPISKELYLYSLK